MGEIPPLHFYGIVMAPKRQSRPKERWHVGKEIPLVLIAAVLLQTIGGIRWLEQLSSKIDNATASIAELKQGRYSGEDARRDRELAETKLQASEQIAHELDRRITNAEARVDRLERK